MEIVSKLSARKFLVIHNLWIVWIRKFLEVTWWLGNECAQNSIQMRRSAKRTFEFQTSKWENWKNSWIRIEEHTFQSKGDSEWISEAILRWPAEKSVNIFIDQWIKVQVKFETARAAIASNRPNDRTRSHGDRKELLIKKWSETASDRHGRPTR